MKHAVKLRGKELARAAINQILENPESWDQTEFHCGTSHCFGGWCQILSGNAKSRNVLGELPELLGITQAEASWVCYGDRLITEIHGFVDCLINDKEYFDRDGFSRDGFDRAGYNRGGVRLPLL